MNTESTTTPSQPDPKTAVPTDEVYEFLAHLNCQKYHEIFLSEEIKSRETINMLGKSDLKELGVSEHDAHLILQN